MTVLKQAERSTVLKKRTIETYNIWLVRREESRYCSTVVCETMNQAIKKTIEGCGILEEELVGWSFVRGNPNLSTSSSTEKYQYPVG